MIVYVLLLVFFYHNGEVRTKTITAPSGLICEAAKPIIVKDYLDHTKGLDNIQSICIEITKG